MTDVKHFETVLKERRAYLVGKQDEIEDKFEHSGDEPFDGDTGEVSNLDVLDDLDEMAQNEIRAIDAALDRIEAVSYTHLTLPTTLRVLILHALSSSTILTSCLTQV